MLQKLFFAFLLAGLTACGPSGGSASEKTTEPPTGPAPAAADPTTVRYPGLPLEKVERLWETCDYIDYIFYGMNFSMSQSEQPAIRASLAHIAEEPAPINPDCNPTGHIFYQAQGENQLEADLYFQEKCVYFVFYEDGKPAYANKMTSTGLQFFKTVFARIREGQSGR